MVDSFEEVQYVPGGATMNTIKVVQVTYAKMSRKDSKYWDR